MKELKVAIVTWEDAHGQNNDVWEDLEYAIKEGEDGKTVSTTGFVVNENKKYITLVMNCGDDDTINGRMTIPKGWIKSIVYLVPETTT